VIERECIEEECSMHEFYEVYDDDNVAGPKYRDYLDCKNYIRREKNDLKNIDSLRACLSSGSPQDPRRREEHQQSEIPKNGNRDFHFKTYIIPRSADPSKQFEVRGGIEAVNLYLHDNGHSRVAQPN